jgi:hypothetical protein
MSSPATRCGFTVMMLKPNNNLHVGRVLLHLTQGRMTGALASESNTFFISKALCIMNLLLKVT